VYVLALLAGLGLLTWGADLLVRGASRIALGYRIPPMVVGLTVVAMGTSMPEMAVSTVAAFNGSADIALGNVNGSALANVFIALGLSAVVAPIVVSRSILGRDLPVAVGMQLLLVLLCWNASLSRIDGVVLLLAGVAYQVWLLRDAVQGRTAVEDVPDAAPGTPTWKNLLFVVVGIGMLVFGGDLFVGGATDLARLLGLSERFIGLTIVAVGTSAPEIATSVVGAYKGEDEISVGNVVGSNIFNVFGVLGVSSVIAPIAVSPETWPDLWLALACLFPLIVLALRGSMGRVVGLVFLAVYAAYVYWLLVAP
jgi:cation:H+ antiporter